MKALLVAAALFLASAAPAVALPDPCPKCRPARPVDDPPGSPWAPAGPNLWPDPGLDHQVGGLETASVEAPTGLDPSRANDPADHPHQGGKQE